MSDLTCAVLFADVAGSTQLYEGLGDAGAKNLITQLQERISHVVGSSGGKVHEIVGDEVVACFDKADSAAFCASEIQHAAALFATQNQSTIAVRIGIHWGPVIVEGKRMFGDTLNTTARMLSVAQAGQIITTETFIKHTSAERQMLARRFDYVKVRGKQDPVVIYDLPWRDNDLTTISPVSVEQIESSLDLIYEEQSVRIRAVHSAFSLGRADGNDLIVDARPVSRRHLLIDFDRGRFVVTDKSTNGTHLYLESGQAIYLRREQIPIWGSGRLALGAPETAPGRHVLTYSCNQGQSSTQKQ